MVATEWGQICHYWLVSLVDENMFLAISDTFYVFFLNIVDVISPHAKLHPNEVKDFPY